MIMAKKSQSKKSVRPKPMSPKAGVKKRMSVVSIGLSTSKAQFINTVVHEAKHV